MQAYDRAELKEHGDRLAAILAAAPSLFRHQDLAGVCEAIVGRAAAVMGTAHGALYLSEAGSPELSRRVAIGRYLADAPARIGRGHGTAGRAWERGQPLAELAGGRPEEPLSALHRAAAPLRTPEGLLGVLEVAHHDPERSFRASDLDVLARFGQLAAMAVEAARLYGAVSQELAERSRIEEELQTQRDFALQVMSRMAQGLVVTDAEGRLEYVNPAFARLLGSSAASLAGKTLSELSRRDEWSAQRTPGLRPGDHTGNQEVELLRADGTATPVALTLAPRFKDGRVAGAIGVVTDLTERRRTEQALLQAKEAAQAASDAKTEFVARLSHEVRTPVHAIMGYTDILLDQLSRLGPEGIRESLERLRESAMHLVSITRGVLDISKIEAGRVDVALRPFDAAELARRTADAATLLAERHGSRLEVGCDPNVGTIRSDPDIVRQVLLNLLSNAGKFTTNGRITLRVRRETVAGADVACFDVEDTGVGIAPEQLERLFTEYARVSGTDDEGSGLGLSISRRLCRVLGGDLVVLSKPGEGSRFTAWLPVEGPAVAPPAAASGTTPVAPGSAPEASNAPPERPVAGTVMLLEGPSGLPIPPELPVWLVEGGFQVDTASAGDELLRLLRERRPDVLVVGALAGASLALHHPELSALPVVALFPPAAGDRALPDWASDRLELPLERSTTFRVFDKYHSRPISPGHRGTALVVDDDLAARTILRRMLEPEGFEVAEAPDGTAALAHVGKQRPDIILLDLMMPGVDGFQLLKELHQHERLRNVPVLVISAMELSRAQSLQLGPQARHVFLKGAYTRADLVRVLRELVPPAPPVSGTART